MTAATMALPHFALTVLTACAPGLGTIARPWISMPDGAGESAVRGRSAP
ncbi:hypothetical protein [Aquisalimonas sp.]|nr:hypothetical protein [Aquisalimonas sp.]